jgi:hypothetical protein
MTSPILDLDAVAEALPGPKWCARWHRFWSAYKTWFRARRRGSSRPGRAAVSWRLLAAARADGYTVYVQPHTTSCPIALLPANPSQLRCSLGGEPSTASGADLHAPARMTGSGSVVPYRLVQDLLDVGRSLRRRVGGHGADARSADGTSRRPVVLDARRSASSRLLRRWRRARVGDGALNLRRRLGTDQPTSTGTDRTLGHGVVPPAAGVAPTLSSSYAARS